MHKVKIIMLFLQLFVSNILIFLVDAIPNYRELTFREHITPLYYKLEIMLPNYFKQNITIDGESRITIRIEENIQQLSFQSFAHIQEVTLHKINPYNVTIRKEPNVRDHLVATYKPRKLTHEFQDSGLVILFFDETIECGYYVLEIIFSTEVTNSRETDGFILTSHENLKRELRWIVTTQTHVKGPQAVFPCWDNPRFKTVFDVSVYHRTSYITFSNSKIHYFKSDTSNVRKWTHFKSTPPIPAHCINIVVLPTVFYSYFTYVDLDNNVTMWTPSSSKSSPYPDYDFAWNITKEVIKYLKEQNLIDQCKVAEINYFAVKKFSPAVVANPSFVLYSKETISVYNWYNDWFNKDHKTINVARLIAQQITYQWILRSTNPLYWPSSRLKDVSNFLAMGILQKVLPNFNVKFWKIENKYDYFSEISFLEYSYITSFILDESDIIKFIISTRTNTLCDSNEEELSLESIFN